MNKKVSYEWFSKESHKYNYFVLDQDRRYSVFERIYTVVICGVKK